jgi:hypothetical protein
VSAFDLLIESASIYCQFMIVLSSYESRSRKEASYA